MSTTRYEVIGGAERNSAITSDLVDLRLLKRTMIIVAIACAALFSAQGAASAEDWALKGDWSESCCCQPACPCVFGSAPSRGFCEGSALFEIEQGHYGSVNVDGISVVVAFSMGEWARLYVDEKASDEQMDAVVKLLSQPGTFGMLVAGDVKMLSVEKAKVSIEKSGSKIAFSVPDSTVEIEAMTGPNGEIIRVENLSVAPWFLNGYSQYRATTTRHKRGDHDFSYSGTNGATSKIDVGGEIAAK